ncbi:hypothetical protein GCM10007198_14040 [Microbacterium aerolatum]|uniref:Uncharacterized protein n=1 Tax=Microbacterium aerolatum TaxID=153731 RepID=A0A511AF80_9MICO|nr:hypothetical protein MAE01_19910 [Microbacterium aerolatum]GGB24872.1 hypothetical protein GCM10007198_14040 [Microbacterium aerolatum]
MGAGEIVETHGHECNCELHRARNDVTISYMTTQLPIPDLHRSISCPVEWCSGSILDHGGAGDEPGDWVHSDGPGVVVMPGLTLCRSQIASGPVRWHLFSRVEEVAQAGTRQELADVLRICASAIEGGTR